MDTAVWFVATLLVGAAGGYAGYRLKLPAGVMLGAMLATIVFNLTTSRGVFFGDLRIAIQFLAGAMIGSRMDIDVARGMRKLVLPIVLLVFSMFLLNIGFGTAMYLSSSLDAATALFSAAPGGASDMAIIAEDLGAYPPHVAILQLSRLIIIFTAMPFVFRKIDGRIKQRKTAGLAVPEGSLPTGVAEAAVSNDTPPHDISTAPVSLQRLLALIAFAVLGGTAFLILGVTAGALIGGMAGSTVFCIWTGRVPFPGGLKLVMQVGAGVFIGMRVDHQTVTTLPELLVPLLVMFCGILAFSLGAGYLIHRLTSLNLMTCLLAATPGGQQEMAFLSEDLAADTPSVAIMQTARLVTVIAFFPTLLGIITQLV